MEILTMIGTIILAAVEGWLMARFVASLWEIRLGGMGTVKTVVFALVGTIAALGLNFLSYGGIMRMIIYALCLFTVLVFFLGRGSLPRTFSPAAAVFIAAGANAVTAEIVYALNGSGEAAPETLFVPTVSLFRISIVLLIMFFSYSAMLRIAPKNAFLLGKWEWRLIISVFAISAVSVILLQITRTSVDESFSAFITFSEIGIAAVMLICFFMTVSLNSAHNETEELRLDKQRREYNVQYAENVKEQYAEMRRIRHDVRQSYAVISALLDKGKNDKAKEYVRQCAEHDALGETLIDVGNDFVNAILNSKLTAARANGIKVMCVSAKDLPPIDDVDLCTLLGNMLDNAAEACAKCAPENRVIEVNIGVGEELSVSVANTFSGEIDGGLATTKPDSDRHGFGVKSIRHIAEKYNGSAAFFTEGDMFCCEVDLPVIPL